MGVSKDPPGKNRVHHRKMIKMASFEGKVSLGCSGPKHLIRGRAGLGKSGAGLE